MNTDLHLVHLLWPLAPHGDTAGSVDWLTGIMALDIPYAQWADLQEEPTPERSEAVLTYAHELMHYVQLVTTGAPYDWSAALLQLVRPIVQRYVHADDPGTGIRHIIEQGDALLTDAEREALGAHMRKLDTPGASGLTMRAIMEGHAYFVERRANFAFAFNGDIYPHLDAAPGLEYRLAFDVLAYAIGALHAVEWFCAVCMVALCTNDPVAAFERMALALRTDAARTLKAEPANYEAMLGHLLRLAQAPALHAPMEQAMHDHPVLTMARDRFRAAMGREVDQLQLYVRPDLALLDLIKVQALRPPIIFRPSLPGQIHVEVPPWSDRDMILALAGIGGVGHRLAAAEAARSQAAGDAALQALAWVATTDRPYLITLAMNDLVHSDPANMIAYFDPPPSVGELPERAWGRILLELPLDHPDRDTARLAEDPLTRRLFQAIDARMPWFGIFLRPDVGSHDWFGALAPVDAFVDGALDLGHPAVVRNVQRFEEAVRERAERRGLNPWLALACMVGRMPR